MPDLLPAFLRASVALVVENRTEWAVERGAGLHMQ